jgi:3-phenylpropionate/trans-cinnamate dioxygenase ferredoxin subunit
VIDFDEEALESARNELNGTGLPEEQRVFIYACDLSDIPPNGRRGKVIETDHEEIAIVNIDGEILAFSNICPHENSPILAAGFFDSDTCTVACPLHGWLYDMRTGERLDSPGSIPVFSVKIDGDQIWVEVLLDDEFGHPGS